MSALSEEAWDAREAGGIVVLGCRLIAWSILNPTSRWFQCLPARTLLSVHSAGSIRDIKLSETVEVFIGCDTTSTHTRRLEASTNSQNLETF